LWPDQPQLYWVLGALQTFWHYTPKRAVPDRDLELMSCCQDQPRYQWTASELLTCGIHAVTILSPAHSGCQLSTTWFSKVVLTAGCSLYKTLLNLCTSFNNTLPCFTTVSYCAFLRLSRVVSTMPCTLLIEACKCPAAMKRDSSLDKKWEGSVMWWRSRGTGNKKGQSRVMNNPKTPHIIV